MKWYLAYDSTADVMQNGVRKPATALYVDGSAKEAYAMFDMFEAAGYDVRRLMKLNYCGKRMFFAYIVDVMPSEELEKVVVQKFGRCSRPSEIAE